MSKNDLADAIGEKLKEPHFDALSQRLDANIKGRRGRRFGEPRTMYDWRGPRPDWYTGPLRSEGDPPPGDLPKAT